LAEYDRYINPFARRGCFLHNAKDGNPIFLQEAALVIKNFSPGDNYALRNDEFPPK